MRYDVRFHGGCFDGASSAAMISYFLKDEGRLIGTLTPFSHPVNQKKWRRPLKNPTAIVDIFYHPDASVWFDHHPTTFINKEWERNFEKDKWHRLDITQKSCAGFIFRSLSQTLKGKIPKHIKELAHWADIIDGAQFPSAKATFDFTAPAVQIEKSLQDKPPLAYQRYLIGQLSQKSLSEVSKFPRVQSRFRKFEKKFKKSLKSIEKEIVLKGVVTFEVIKRGVTSEAGRYAPYYFYPQAKYNIRFQTKGGKYILGVGWNPWNKPKNPLKIGDFLRDKYKNGGGHAYAGSARFNTKKDAEKAIGEIVEACNKHT